MGDGETIQVIVEKAVEGFEGAKLIGKASGFLQSEIAAQRFNSERALEVFLIATDNAVWSFVKDMPMASKVYHDYKSSGLGRIYAAKIVGAFKEETGAEDQRPARKFLRNILGA
jgi:hypothetical protein